MSDSKGKFAAAVRKELLEMLQSRKSYIEFSGPMRERHEIVLPIMMAAALRVSPAKTTLEFSSRQREFVHYIAGEIERYCGSKVAVQEKKTMSKLVLLGRSHVDRFRMLESALLNTSPEVYFKRLNNWGDIDFLIEEFAPIEGVPVFNSLVLATLFLACGSLSDPVNGYMLYFSLPDKSKLTKWVEGYLHCIGIPVKKMKRNGRCILYVKDGETIAAFLSLSLAHKTLLKFENIRVKAKFNAEINRSMNFDNANIDRQSESWLRIKEDIDLIKAEGAYEDLNAKLKDTIKVCEENPGASLAEIGKLLEPPIGKSGVYHRVRKLKNLADEIREDFPELES